MILGMLLGIGLRHHGPRDEEHGIRMDEGMNDSIAFCTVHEIFIPESHRFNRVYEGAVPSDRARIVARCGEHSRADEQRECEGPQVPLGPRICKVGDHARDRVILIQYLFQNFWHLKQGQNDEPDLHKGIDGRHAGLKDSIVLPSAPHRAPS